MVLPYADALVTIAPLDLASGSENGREFEGERLAVLHAGRPL
jgi:hypothetical protein